MSVYYNDIDPYCCKVLRKQIHLGNLPEGHVDERDIREVRASDLVGYRHIHLFAGIGGFPLGFKWAGFPDHISILTGGFPCQDISNAGKRAGIDGERSGLWSEMYRLICDIRPQYICVENVAALLYRGIDRVLGDLAQSGYDAQWQVLPAAAFGAPHRRDRIFIVAYISGIGSHAWGAKSERQQWKTNTHRNGAQEPLADTAGKREITIQQQGRVRSTKQGGQDVADTTSHAWQLQQSERQNLRNKPAIYGKKRITRSDYWAVEPNVGRVAHGIPHRVDRLKGLGNSIVPQIPEYIARCIMAHAAESESVA